MNEFFTNVINKTKQKKSDITNYLSNKFQEDNAVNNLLKASIDGISNLLKAIDKVLNIKSKVSNLYSKSKDGAITLKDKFKQISKDSISKLPGISGLTNLFKKEKIDSKEEDKKKSEKTDNGPPKETSSKNRLLDTFKKYKERISKRQSEVDEEKANAKQDKKKDKGLFGDGIFGKILTAIMGLGGTIVSGITGGMKFLLGDILLKRAVPMLGKAILTGSGWLLTKLIKYLPGLGGLAGKLAKGTQSVLGKGIKGLAKGAWNVATSAKTWKALGTVGKVAGTGLLRAGGLLLTGPVGWTIAAGGLAYAGYLGYKRLTRNNASKVTKIRLMQYGLDSKLEDNYHLMFSLEEAVKGLIVKLPNNTYKMNPITKKIQNDIFDLFELDPENNDDKDKIQIFINWFKNRFLATYISHVNAIGKVTPSISLENIDKLKDGELKKFISNLTVTSNIYKINKMYLNNEIKDISITKSDVDNYTSSVFSVLTSSVPEKKEEILVKKKPEVTNKSINKPINENIKSEDFGPPRAVKTSYSMNTDLSKQYNVDNDNYIRVNPSNTINTAKGPMVTPSVDLEGINILNNDNTSINNLDPNVKILFTSMAAEYKKLTGKDIPVIEGFRSFERQKELYQKYPYKAAKPGNSLHEFGLAIDIDSSIADELDKLGLMRKYGFTRPIGKEKWHIEPVGVSIDPIRSKEDKEFRIEAINASIGKGGGGYGTLDNSVLKRRNIEYQIGLLTNSKDNIVDNSNMNLITKNNSNSIYTVEYNKTDVAKEPSAAVQKAVYTPTIGAEDITPPEAVKKPSTAILKKNMVAYQGNIDLNRYGSLTPQQAIAEASKLTNVGQDTLMKFASLESSFRPNVKAKTTSATGLFQFTDRTWKYMLNSFGRKYNIPSDAKPTNPLYNSILAGEYIKYNLSQIGTEYKKANMDEVTAAYLAHHYGATGAKKIIKEAIKNPNSSISSVVSANAYKYNRQELTGHSISSYIQKVSNKLDNADISSSIPRNIENNNTDSYIYKPTPSISKPDTTLNKTVSSVNVDLSTMENIATKQLSVLESIRSIILEIANKELTTKQNKEEITKPSISNNTSKYKTIPNSKIDVSRNKHLM